MTTIINIACKNANVSFEELMSKCRQYRINIVRWFLWKYLHEEYGISATQLGKMFNRSRRIIFRGIFVFKQMLHYDASVREFNDNLIKKIEAAIK